MGPIDLPAGDTTTHDGRITDLTAYHGPAGQSELVDRAGGNRTRSYRTAAQVNRPNRHHHSAGIIGQGDLLHQVAAEEAAAVPGAAGSNDVARSPDVQRSPQVTAKVG